MESQYQRCSLCRCHGHTKLEHKCSKCGGVGHRGIYCTKTKVSRRRTRRVQSNSTKQRHQSSICYLCGLYGHTADKHVCGKCHRFGHRGIDCYSSNTWTSHGHHEDFHCGQSCPCCRYKVEGNPNECRMCAALDGR